MDILEYKEAKYIPENLLQSLMKSEIECWWSEPFSEYKICSDCKAIFSIEEVHGSVENFRNGKNCWDNFQCLECCWKTKYMYKTDEFLDLVKEYIKGYVSAVLLVTSEGNVEWFGILSKTTISSILKNELNTRPNSYDIPKLKEILFNEIDKFIWSEILCLHQLYIYKDYRVENRSFNMMKKMFTINKSFQNIPIILETRYDCIWYLLWRLFWSKNLIDDRHWYVVQIIKNYSIFFEFLKKNSWPTNELNSEKLLPFKKESIKILKNKKYFSERKFYS